MLKSSLFLWWRIELCATTKFINLMFNTKYGLPFGTLIASTVSCVSLSGSSASLSWQKGDDRQTGFSIKRKQSIEGEFEEIGSINSDSFSDNSISSGNTYWYRVFATNEYGEGTGSNVVTITYPE